MIEPRTPAQTARVQAFMRAELDKLIERLLSGEVHGVTLTRHEVGQVLYPLLQLQAGYDARDKFGIRHKSGQRPIAMRRDHLLAIYVLKLSLEQPQIALKTHYKTAATDTGHPESRIRKAVSVHRKSAMAAVRRGAWGREILLVLLRNLRVFQTSPGELRKK